jgi:hypothetical protein
VQGRLWIRHQHSFPTPTPGYYHSVFFSVFQLPFPTSLAVGLRVQISLLDYDSSVACGWSCQARVVLLLRNYLSYVLSTVANKEADTR